MKELEEYLSLEKIFFQKDVSLASISTIRAGGTCGVVVSPDTVDKIRKLICFFRQKNIKYIVVGRLSNIIFRDGFIQTVIVVTSKLKSHGFEGKDFYRAQSGVGLPSIAYEISKLGYEGFSGLVGVPGSIGGAVYMNASSYGHAISDYLVSVTCINESGELFEFQKDDLDFSWRKSAFQTTLRDMTILEACFRLVPGNKSEINLHMKESIHNRRLFLENNHPNLGSTFSTRHLYGELSKKFFLYRMGYSLVRVWIKLFPKNGSRLRVNYTKLYFGIKDSDRVGLSDRTINCVVNKGGASASEIIQFVRVMQKKINYCVPLEIEIFEDVI